MEEKIRIRLDGFGLAVVAIGLALLFWFWLGLYEGGVVPIIRFLSILVWIPISIYGGAQAIIGRNIGGGLTTFFKSEKKK